MKRFLLWGLSALCVMAALESSASAWPNGPGIGQKQRHVGRVEGYWMQPTRGPLYDYSSYFATKYPWLPGAQEYQGQPNQPGHHGQPGMTVAPQMQMQKYSR